MADGVVEYILRLTDRTKTGTRSAVVGSEQLEKQTKQTTRAVDALGDESAQTGRQLSTMGQRGQRATAGLSGLSKGLTGALSSVSGMTAGVGGLVAALGVGALVGTLTAATRALFEFGQEIADLRNDITDASTRSGIAAETLQGLRLAAEGSGLSFSALTGGLDQFGRRMKQASEGGNATADAFAALKVRIDDGAGGLRDADEVFRETLARLNEMEKGAERSAIANDILGRSGTKLLQALSGSELEDFVALANEFGVNVGPDAADSAGRWQRASAELTTVLDGLKAQIFDLLGGSDLLDDFSESAILAFAYLEGAIEGFAEGFENAADRILAPIETLIESVAKLVEGLEKIGTGDFTGGLKSLEAAMAAVVRTASATPGAVATGLTGGIVEASFMAGFRGAERMQTEGRAEVARLRELRGRSRSSGAGGGDFEGDGDGDGDGQGARTGAGVDIDTELARMFGNEILAITNSTLQQVTRVGRAGGVVGADLEAQRRNDEFLDALVAETRAGRLEAAQTGIGVAGQVLSGDIGGAVSSAAGAAGLAGLGVAGAAISGLQFIGSAGAEGIKDTLNGVKDSLLGALEALPELIGEVLPQFAISLISELIPALIEASPEILKSLIVDLPVAIAVALGRVLRETFGRGENRGRNIGAAIGGVGGFILAGPLGAVAGAGAGAAVGAGAQDIIENVRDSRGRNAARTASDGQASNARAADRLAVMSTRPRRSRSTVQTNPFDQLARQFDNQFGTYGRASAATIGAT